MQHEEYQYLNLIRDIIENGSYESETRGHPTYVKIGNMMRFSLANNTIPVLTTKRVAVKTCLIELLWFLRGETDNNKLTKEGVHIWDLNGSKEFLASRGLEHYRENDLGPIYGYQWRSFNKPYTHLKVRDIVGDAIPSDIPIYDQIQRVIDDLKNPETRSSRRHIVSAWNPCQIDEMALPPCHIMFQFHVTHGNKLSCSMYQRSGDVGLGVPFNIMSYSALTHLIAHHCGLEAHEFIYFLGNAHIYDTHKDVLMEQLKNEPYPFPTIKINENRDNINDYVLEDFVIENYKHHKTIKMTLY